MADDDVEGTAMLVVPDASAPVRLEPVTLIQAIRQLQKRIPGYTQLSLEEEHKMLRAASLDPEFVHAGVTAAGVWEDVQAVTGLSAEEFQSEAAATAEWDDVERELLILTKGIAHANLKRKHRLGKAVLRIYFLLRLTADDPERSHLRPYFDEMRRVYMKRRKRKKRGEGKDEEGEPGE